MSRCMKVLITENDRKAPAGTYRIAIRERRAEGSRDPHRIIQVWSVDVDPQQFSFAIQLATNHANSVGAMVLDDHGGINNPDAYKKQEKK